MDWRELERMIKDERKAGNPVACLIHSLQLDQNKVRGEGGGGQGGTSSPPSTHLLSTANIHTPPPTHTLTPR